MLRVSSKGHGQFGIQHHFLPSRRYQWRSPLFSRPVSPFQVWSQERKKVLIFKASTVSAFSSLFLSLSTKETLHIKAFCVPEAAGASKNFGPRKSEERRFLILFFHDKKGATHKGCWGFLFMIETRNPLQITNPHNPVLINASTQNKVHICEILLFATRKRYLLLIHLATPAIKYGI